MDDRDAALWSKVYSCQIGKRVGLIDEKLFKTYLAFRSWSKQKFQDDLASVNGILVHGKTSAGWYNSPHGDVSYRGPYTQIAYDGKRERVERSEGQVTGMTVLGDGYCSGIQLHLELDPFVLGSTFEQLSPFIDLPRVRGKIISSARIRLFVPIDDNRFFRQSTITV